MPKESKVNEKDKKRTALLTAAKKMFKQRLKNNKQQSRPQAQDKQRQTHPQYQQVMRLPFRIADDLDLKESIRNARPERAAELAEEVGRARARYRAKRLPESATKKYFKMLDARKKRENTRRQVVVFRPATPGVRNE